MSYFLLLSMCCAGDAAKPVPPKVEFRLNSLDYVEVDVDAGRTNARGLQVVTVRLKLKAMNPDAIRDLNLQLSTRDPMTKIHVIYPKVSGNLVGPFHSFQEGEIFIQSILERAPGDQSPVQGLVEFRMERTFC